MFRNPLEAIKKLPEDKQRKVYKKLAGKLIDGEFGDILTGIIAGKEVALLEAVQEQHDLLGIDQIDGIPSKEERKDLLKDLTNALIRDEVPEYWFDHAGRHMVDDADRAEDFLALDADEWGEKCDQIVAAYRKQGNTEMGRGEIMADYVNRKFGVPLDEFVANVVRFDQDRKREIMRRFLVGNFEAVEDGLDTSNQILAQAREQQDQEGENGE